MENDGPPTAQEHLVSLGRHICRFSHRPPFESAYRSRDAKVLVQRHRAGLVIQGRPSQSCDCRIIGPCFRARIPGDPETVWSFKLDHEAYDRIKLHPTEL